MGWFDRGKASVGKLLNAGKNKDILQAACAVSAMAAARSGDVSNDEEREAITIIIENRVIQAAGWQQHEVASLFSSYVPKAKRFSGKIELWKEVNEGVARDNTGEVAQFLVGLAADVCASDGNFDEVEKGFVREVGQKVGINDLSAFGL